MTLRTRIVTSRLGFLLLALGTFSTPANAQATAPGTNSPPMDANTTEVLQKIDQLVEQNKALEKQNQKLVEELQVLRQAVAKETPATPEGTKKEAAPATNTTVVATSPSEQPKAGEQPKWGSYTPNAGYKIVNTDYGDVNLSIYTYGRYLNQLGLDATYMDAFGNVKNVQRRQDFQLNKLQIKFLGWVMSPKFRYFLYAWTSNASQGQGAQVVLAGNMTYNFDKKFNVGFGIRSLPGTRSVEGNFPFWLGVDTRLIADEFFRPSYTSGVWGYGKITDSLEYISMIGNNLSTLGVSAAQLNNGFDTWSSALVWTPGKEKFGVGFGDFEGHKSLATRLGARFTRSTEDKQEQPSSDQFENTQIRLEDGSVIFTPNLFGAGISVEDVTYKMASFDGGLKLRGLSLEGEYFLRWLDNFHGPGTAGLPSIFSHGFQLQASAMILPKTLQAYLGGSTIYGKYGNPYDFRAGLNYFPFHNKVIRWNNEFLYLYQSPVGYTSVPFALGGTGPIFHTNLELAF